MAFEVVAVSLCENSVPVSLSLVPLAFIDISVIINHSAFALGHAVDPVAIVPVVVLEEEGASAVFLVLEPVSGVLPAQFVSVEPPVGALAMLLVHGPHAFVLVSILVELNSEAFLAVVAPVSDVAAGAGPLFALD
jgi:hypothetical protein